MTKLGETVSLKAVACVRVIVTQTMALKQRTSSQWQPAFLYGRDRQEVPERRTESLNKTHKALPSLIIWTRGKEGRETEFNEREFGDTTLEKLRLFECYIGEWLPVFISNVHRGSARVNIVDFFAGSGSDTRAHEGSALLILRLLFSHLARSTAWSGQVHVHFNDIRQRTIERLKDAVSYGGYEIHPKNVRITYHNKGFQELFSDLYPDLKIPGSANLLIIDQSGNFQFTHSVFDRLLSLERTDALVFFASYFLHRFKKKEEFFQGFSGLRQVLLSADHRNVHAAVKDYLQSRIPKSKEYYIGKYTLRSVRDSSRIYGVIFCSPHIHGIVKFVRCASHQRKSGSGEQFISASKAKYGQGMLFQDDVGSNSATTSPDGGSVDFKAELRKKIVSGALVTDRDVSLECMMNGFEFEEGRSVVAQMIRTGIITNRLRISEDAIRQKDRARRIEVNHDKIEN